MTLLLQSRRGTIYAREKLACRAGELKEFVLPVEQAVYAHRVPDSRKKKVRVRYLFKYLAI